MPAILVFAEVNETHVSERSARLLSAACALAGAGGSVAAVVAAPALPENGLGNVARVYFARVEGLATSEDAIAAILDANGRLKPDVILLPNSIAGIDAAGPVAIRTERPLVAYCTNLAVQDAAITAQCDMFGGRAAATVEAALPAVVIATLAPSAAFDGAGVPAEVVALTAPQGPSRITVESVSAPAAGGVDIASAERIVCVGRGIGEQENIDLARDLAEALGAELGASRPLVDLNWVEKDRQVGKSGRTVKPKIYIGLGVSGATEHVEGMRDSALVIAVNTNASAPIFEIARWGTTCDVLELLPVLTEKLRAAKA